MEDLARLGEAADPLEAEAAGEARPLQADVADLFRRMVFNALVTNLHDHPRNHAVTDQDCKNIAYAIVYEGFELEP